MAAYNQRHHHNSSNTTGTTASPRILRLSGGMHLDILISRLKAAASNLSSRGRIQEISCLNAQLDWISEPLVELLHSQSHWMKLEFVHCHGIDSVLSQLNSSTTSTGTQTKTQIEILSCKGDCSDHIPTAISIAKGLQTSSIQTLELNDFFTCCESMKVITTGIASASASLEYLDVSNSTWPTMTTTTTTVDSRSQDPQEQKEKQPLDYLIQALATTHHLKGFACENCRLSDVSMASIVQAVRQHSNLHSLRLRGNSCQQLTLQALANIPSSLLSPSSNICIESTFASSLELLTITNHDALSEDPIPGLDDFFTALALQHYPNLQSLSIAEYMIPLEYMQTLVSALLVFNNNNCSSSSSNQNKGITNLNFKACGLRTSTIRYLSNKLPQMVSLHSLSLPDDGSTHELLGCCSCNHDRQNHRNGDSSRCICGCDGRGLKGNTTLCHLSMSQVPLTMWHEYYLDMNRGGRRLLATTASSRPKISTPTTENDAVEDIVLLDKLWPIVLERAERRVSYYGGPKRCHDVVYLLLRNKILLEQR